MVVFKGKKKAREIRNWIEEFQKAVIEAAGNQYLQFTVEIWTTEENSPTPAKEERVKIATKDELPVVDIKLISSPEGDQKFGVFRKKGQHLKYVRKESTHTPGSLCAIPLGVLNRLAKLTLKKPSIHSEGIEKILPNHARTLPKAGLAPPN